MCVFVWMEKKKKKKCKRKWLVFISPTVRNQEGAVLRFTSRWSSIMQLLSSFYGRCQAVAHYQ